MAEIRNFFESSDAVKIEVEGGAGARHPYFREFVGALSSLTSAISGEVGQIPTEQRPNEFTIQFGLKALDAGGFAISQGETSAQFRVSLKWGSPEAGLLPGAGLPAPEL
jgi:hypothetical protein